MVLAFFLISPQKYAPRYLTNKMQESACLFIAEIFVPLGLIAAF